MSSFPSFFVFQTRHLYPRKCLQLVELACFLSLNLLTTDSDSCAVIWACQLAWLGSAVVHLLVFKCGSVVCPLLFPPTQFMALLISGWYRLENSAVVFAFGSSSYCEQVHFSLFLCVPFRVKCLNLL